MTETEKIILEQWQVRKKRAQKTAFLEFMQTRFPEARVEQAGYSRNLVIGDPEAAKLVLTAHYDTCARLPFPNLLMPKNMLGNLLYGLAIAMPLVLLSGVLGGVIGGLLESPLVTLVICYGVLGGFLWMMFGGIPNPNTVNDNTSGVCMLVRLLETLPEALRRKCCFVFFDNEENGLLGSSGFFKLHKTVMRDKPLLNFDCVSDGEHILLFPGRKARPDWVAQLQAAFRSRDGKTVTVEKPGRGMYPSDQVRFPQGAGVAAFRKARFWGLFISRIHTRRDTVWQEENLCLLRDCCEELIGNM